MGFKRQQLGALRKEIARLAEEGRSYNERISGASGPARHALRLEKSGVGRYSRVCLLAYGMLRGVPYRSIERSTRDAITVYISDLVLDKARSSLPEGGSLREDSAVVWLSEDAGRRSPEAAQ